MSEPTPTVLHGAVETRANVYFDGRCVSHTVRRPDGSKISVGVILPATLVFNTGEAEVMETVAGACEVLLPGATVWQAVGPGERFSVPAHSRFQIRVSGEPYHYLCHFG